MSPLRFCVLPLLAAGVLAQTTGVPGINDLQVNAGGPWLGSGSTSCFNTCVPNGNVGLTYSCSAPAGAFVLMAFNLCPCAPCSLTAPANPCVPPIPATACFGSNQSWDLNTNAACGPLLTLVQGPTTTGVIGVNVNVPFIPGPPCTNITLSCQAVIFDPCGLGLTIFPGAFLVSQAISVSF